MTSLMGANFTFAVPDYRANEIGLFVAGLFSDRGLAGIGVPE
jgi:hypothetical protein